MVDVSEIVSYDLAFILLQNRFGDKTSIRPKGGWKKQGRPVNGMKQAAGNNGSWAGNTQQTGNDVKCTGMNRVDNPERLCHMVRYLAECGHMTTLSVVVSA